MAKVYNSDLSAKLDLCRKDVELDGRWVSSDTKFGRNESVGSTFVPISLGGFFRTPQIAGAQALRVKAGDAGDTAAGAGAQEVTIVGINTSGYLVQEAVATAGTSASAFTTTQFIRTIRAFVSKSGTYASVGTPSHVATIEIEDAGANVWLRIDGTQFPAAQSEQGVLTTPRGFDLAIAGIAYSVESTKTVNLGIYQRGGVLETAPPYQAARIKRRIVGISGGGAENTIPFDSYLYVPELSDVGFQARTTAGTTSQVSTELDYFLIRKTV